MTRKQKSAWAVLTTEEEKQLLETTRRASDRESFRDYVLLSVALGAGLRVRELAELRVRDITTPTGRIKQVVDLPWAKMGSTEPAYLGEPVRARLASWVQELSSKAGGKPAADAALWPSAGSKTGRVGAPLSKRGIQAAIQKRIKAAGIGRRVRCHDLRHTSLSRVAERTNGNLPVVQKFARHADPRTTAKYIHAPLGVILRAADGALVG